MRILLSLRILGLLLMIFSSTMIIPILISLSEQGNTVFAFLYALALTFSSGLILWLASAGSARELRIRDGFLITSLFWCVLGCFGSLPFYFSDAVNLTLIESIFESISGLTTTGATVLTGLDDLPKSVLFYRQFLQWLGGIGIIVVAVAILPMLGIGGMQLYKAETPGPSKGSKIAPRITETAKALFLVYLTLTGACAAAYFLAGMSWFDAICHSFSTVAIGGFSTHDASFSYFEGLPGVFMISSLFMFLAGINFTLHFFAWKDKSIIGFLKDSEFKAYLLLLVLVICVAGLSFSMSGSADNGWPGLLQIIFQVISIGTTTGYTSSDYFLWPAFIPFLLIIYSFIGGCVGSTGGGLKVGRCLMMVKQVFKELKQLVHPSAEIPVKMNAKTVDERVLNSVWGFVSAYLIILVLFSLILMLSGLDQVSSFSAIAASLNNLGPGLGEVSNNYAALSDFNKWVCVLAMILGRLEIFALLVLLTPTFWRD